MVAALDAGPDLSADVPSCPGWSLEALTNHTGRIVGWATAAVRAGIDDPEGGAVAPPPFPARPESVDSAWFGQVVDGLVSVLEEAGAESSSWNHLQQPKQSRFWFRRQAHELAVHRWDAENARRPGQADPVDTELALDGIDELVDLMFTLGYQGQDLGGSVHLHATDSPHGEWLFRTVDGELLVGHDHQNADAAVHATASDLLLWLWGRLPADTDRVERSGDATVLDSFREVLKAP